eukprot:2858655-Prymnesium_polylepis.1
MFWQLDEFDMSQCRFECGADRDSVHGPNIQSRGHEDSARLAINYKKKTNIILILTLLFNTHIRLFSSRRREVAKIGFAGSATNRQQQHDRAREQHTVPARKSAHKVTLLKAPEPHGMGERPSIWTARPRITPCSPSSPMQTEDSLPLGKGRLFVCCGSLPLDRHGRQLHSHNLGVKADVSRSRHDEKDDDRSDESP